MTAIDRLRDAYFGDDDCVTTFIDDLAKLEALHQAAKEALAALDDGTELMPTGRSHRALAAAVKAVDE